LLNFDGVLEFIMRGIKVLFFILLLTGLSECTISTSGIGADFFANSSTFDISYLDSVTLKVSTVLKDSLITSDTKRLLVGYHQDEKLGTITSQGVFQVGISNAIVLDKSTTEYVGLRLNLNKDGYSFYDTTKSQTVSVYQLTKGLVANTGLYYNTSKFSINRSAPPLGTLTFSPRPKHTTDSLEIALSDDLGRQLMTMAQTSDPRLSTNLEFIRYFKGLALIPDTLKSRAFVGFQSAGASKPSEMRLYYKDRTTTPVTVKHISFPIGNNANFNHIHPWRSGTKLSSLKKVNQMVSSVVTDHEGYFQCGTSLAMRVEMPYLNTLRNNDPGFLSTRAMLEFKPIRSSYITDPLPPVLVMYIVDGQNNLLSATPLAIRLVKDLEYGRNTVYQCDVTSFVNSQIPTIVNTQYALLILLGDSQYRSTVNRLYIGDPMNADNMRLRLYYLTLPNQPN
jgi:hypothetical protein